jgi:hypothetical protein
MPRLMLGLEPALDLAGTEHMAHVHPLGKTLERVPPEIPVVEQRSDQAVGDRQDYEGIGLGNRLQTRHQVRRLAYRGILLGDALTGVKRRLSIGSSGRD